MTESSLAYATPSVPAGERRARLLWTGFIGFFFFLQAVLWTVAISLTANDPSSSVIADYEQKAVTWDEDAAVRRASQQLGWQVDISVAAGGDLAGDQVMLVEVHDGESLPLNGARIELTAFHRAWSGRPQQVIFRSAGPGKYTGTLMVHQSGRWQLEGTIREGDAVHVIDQVLNLTSKVEQPQPRLQGEG